jgi:hypothetical protein
MRRISVPAGTVLVLVVVGNFSDAQLSRRKAGYSFPSSVESRVGNQQVKLVLTGSAIRYQRRFQVYAIGSYLQEGVKVRTAKELASSDSPKQLHIVMLRSVSGAAMADAFESVFRGNHPAPAFKAEVQRVVEAFRATSVASGEHIWLTHIPKQGLECRWGDRKPIRIDNADFSRAVWDNYLGKVNVGENVKEGLTSRLAGG